MSKKKKENIVENIESVESALSRSEQFIEDNQKIITIAIVAVVVVVSLFLAYQKWYVKPMEEEASAQMFVAEQYFERDSFNLALNGDVNYPGFLSIIDEYSSTKSGNLANYYAGISYLRLAQYENAIKYLSDFSSNDKTLKPMSFGAIGDANLELGNVDEAVKYYEKAGNYAHNEFVSPLYLLRAGRVLESQKKYKKALEIYKEIKEKYRKSTEGRIIDKYISRVELLSK